MFIIVIMLYVTSPVLTFLITTRLYLLIAFIQFPLPQSPASGNHTSDFFFFSLNLFIFEMSPTYNTLSVSLVQHGDSVFLYISKWSPRLSRVTVCHHVKILHNDWLGSPHCTVRTPDSFILQLEICASSAPSPVSLLPPPHLCVFDCLFRYFC